MSSSPTTQQQQSAAPVRGTAERELEKQLKIAAKTGKYVVGRREVQSGIKGSKLLVWSSSANIPQAILDDSRSLSIPAVRFKGNPVELGRACGIPFRVSVIALKSPGDADISAFAGSADYATTSSPVVSAGGSIAPEVEGETGGAEGGRASPTLEKKKLAKKGAKKQKGEVSESAGESSATASRAKKKKEKIPKEKGEKKRAQSETKKTRGDNEKEGETEAASDAGDDEEEEERPDAEPKARAKATKPSKDKKKKQQQGGESGEAEEEER